MKCTVCQQPGKILCNEAYHTLCEEHSLGFTDKCELCSGKLTIGNCENCSTQTILIKCLKLHSSCKNCCNLKTLMCKICSAEDLCQSCQSKNFEKIYFKDSRYFKVCGDCYLLEVCSYCNKNFTTKKLCKKHGICDSCLKNTEACTICNQYLPESNKITFSNPEKLQIQNKKLNQVWVENKSKNQEVNVMIWDCNCGASNMPDFEVCQQCYRIKPGVKGWVCEICKALNSTSDNECSACYSIKDKRIGVNQEFWICKMCKCAIINEYNFCDNCMIDKYGKKIEKMNVKKPTEEKKMVDIPLIKDNEWRCHKCSKVNDSLTYCTNCFERKPNPIKKKEATGNSPWKCKNCNVQMDYYFNKCSNCNRGKIYVEYKDEEDIYKSLTNKLIRENVVEDLDVWKCSRCNSVNKIYSKPCSKCGFIKENVSQYKTIQPVAKISCILEKRKYY